MSLIIEHIYTDILLRETLQRVLQINEYQNVQ
jgi:hypothetical protein